MSLLVLWWELVGAAVVGAFFRVVVLLLGAALLCRCVVGCRVFLSLLWHRWTVLGAGVVNAVNVALLAPLLLTIIIRCLQHQGSACTTALEPPQAFFFCLVIVSHPARLVCFADFRVRKQEKWGETLAPKPSPRCSFSRSLKPCFDAPKQLRAPKHGTA